MGLSSIITPTATIPMMGTRLQLNVIIEIQQTLAMLCQLGLTLANG
jgi:hypothetical protein